MYAELLTVKQISEIYGIPRSIVYELLHMKTDPCPIVKGGDGKHYLIERSAFDNWLKNRNAQMLTF